MSSEMKMLQKTVLDLKKQLETARKQATKDIAGKGGSCHAQKDLFEEIYMAAGKKKTLQVSSEQKASTMQEELFLSKFVPSVLHPSYEYGTSVTL